MAPQQIIREYTYVYGTVMTEEGVFDGLILPDMSAETMTIFLEEISQRHPDRYILMVIDGAPCHSAGVLKVPDNIKILTLPPYSPQLNPVENLWDEMREKWFCNCVFKDMAAVENRLVEAVLDFESAPERTKSITAWDCIMNSLK